MRAAVSLALLALLVLGAGGAQAHRLNVFAYAEGATIIGSAYFSGGGAPAGAEVTVYGPDGAELGRTATDGDGAFAFDATARVDHRITVATQDGHTAEFLVAASELLDGLPAADTGPAASVHRADATSSATARSAGESPAAVAAIDDAALEALVSQAVQRQVRPLREQLLACGDRIGLQDIIGGIGYIVGIFGIAAYVLSLRRRPTGRHGGGADRAAAE